MTPFLVLISSSLLFRLIGRFGVQGLNSWQESARFGLIVMFLFTGSTHFTTMKHDYAAMIPPPFTGSVWLITITGVLEIAGALGLFVRKTRKAAAICLAILLVALFPANIYAAVNNIPFRGESPTELWIRGPLQVIFAFVVWWSSIKRPGRHLTSRSRQRMRDPQFVNDLVGNTKVVSNWD